MTKQMSASELLDLARSAIGPSESDRARIGAVLGARLDAFDTSTGGSVDASHGPLDSAGGLDVAAHGSWLSGIGAKIGAALLLVAGVSAWWMSGASTSPQTVERARPQQPAAVAAPAATASPEGVAHAPSPPASAVGAAPGPDSVQGAVAREFAPEPPGPAQRVPEADLASEAPPVSHTRAPKLARSAAARATPRQLEVTARAASSGAHASATAARPSVATAGTPQASDSAGAADEPEAAEADPLVPPSRPPDLLMAELSLIDEASRALGAGRAAEALEALDRHRVLYGEGKLAVEREGLRAVALCALGRVEAARKQAQSFLRRYPSSPLAERVRGAADCSR